MLKCFPDVHDDQVGACNGFNVDPGGRDQHYVSFSNNFLLANFNMERTHKANMLQVTECEKKNELAMERIDDVKVNMYERLEKAVEEL